MKNKNMVLVRLNVVLTQSEPASVSKQDLRLSLLLLLLLQLLLQLVAAHALGVLSLRLDDISYQYQEEVDPSADLEHDKVKSTKKYREKQTVCSTDCCFTSLKSHKQLSFS